MAKPPHGLIYRATQIRVTLMIGQWQRSITLGALALLALVLFLLMYIVAFVSAI